MPKGGAPKRYRDAIAYLYGLQRLGIKFGLDNIRRVLHAIGDPQDRLQAVHVGGSNGKGSTAAHLEALLMSSGHRVGLYTSPHFLRFPERIRINQKPISEEDVVRWTGRILEEVPGLWGGTEGGQMLPITFFEFTTAMAFGYFEEKGVDIAILEVGMGGRLDATNVCRPLVSIITTVSLEHREFLGETLGQIATEKAGIIKPGVPVVSGVSHPSALGPIEERARSIGAPLFRLGRDFMVRGRPDRFSYRGLCWRLSDLATPLRGRHQMRNAALALAACEVLSERGFSLRPREVPKGLQEVCWRGRQEWHPGPPQLLLDGAHNPEAVRSLRRSLLADYRYGRLWILMGVMREKDYGTMVRILAPLADGFVFCRPRMERALDPRILLKEALRAGVRDGKVVEDVAEALRGLVRHAASDDLVCVTGSLFTVGEAMALLEKNDLHHLRSMS